MGALTGRRVLSLASIRLLPLFLVSSSGSQTLEVTSHFAYAAKGAASANRLVLVGGPQDVGQLSVATGRRALSLASIRLPPLFLVSSSSA